MTTPAPARLPIPNGYQLTVGYNQGGQRANTVHGFLRPAGTRPSQAVAQALLDAFWTLWRPHFHSGMACSGGVLRETGANADVWELTAPPNNLGGQAAPATVAGASYLVKWSTTRGGRSGKGRTYFPGVTEGAVDNSGRAWEGSLPASFATTIAAYVGDSFGGGEFDPALLSFKRGDAIPITGGALAAVPGIQRRRMRG